MSSGGWCREEEREINERTKTDHIATQQTRSKKKRNVGEKVRDK
jgi:hypothetical protein